jgi:probable phosphoglycerate mutase
LSPEDRFAGSTDVLLSEEGQRQASELATRLSGLRLAAVYSSPLQRSLRTAEILAAPHSLAVTQIKDFREISHGRWEGLTRGEVEKSFAQEYLSWDADPFTFAPLGGETGLSVLARALPALREVVLKHERQTVLIVSHKSTIRLLIGSFLGFDLREYRDRLDQQPCCLNVLDFKDPARMRLMLFNDISHYHDHPKTPKAVLSKSWDALKK